MPPQEGSHKYLQYLCLYTYYYYYEVLLKYLKYLRKYARLMRSMMLDVSASAPPAAWHNGCACPVHLVYARSQHILPLTGHNGDA